MPPSTRSSSDWAAAAATAWAALERAYLRNRRAGGLRLIDAYHRRATLWPLTQVLHAAAMRAERTGDRTLLEGLWAGIADYDSDRGWTDGVRRSPTRDLYYDDHAWVGLAASAAGLATTAQRALAVVDSGAVVGGGIRWREDGESRHACSTAPGALLATIVGGDRAAAEQHADWLWQRLRRDDGLIADHMAGERRDDAVYSYNQGATVSLLLSLDRPSQAQELAARTAGWFAADDTLWRQPPAFNAIAARGLLRLAAAGEEQYRDLFYDYGDRLLREGLDRRGLVGAGGIGRYDGARVVDQGGVLQLLEMLARPKGWAGLR